MEIQKVNIYSPKELITHDPLLMKGMKEALGRIAKAVNEREKIVIYGYYDVDSITAISLLMLVLKYLNADVEYFVSSSIDDKFDINSEEVKDYIKLLGTKLIVTVGCGINSTSQVELCKKLDIDVIITDYHKCKGNLPYTYILDPNQGNCNYPFKGLSAVGVAFKVSQAISMYYQMRYISKYLDLVTLGTVFHGTNLFGENKIMVDEGLLHFNCTNNYGLKALLKVYNIDDIDVFNVYNLAKNIISSIKCKRTVDNARIAVELFTTSSMDRAEQIAKYLKNETLGNGNILYKNFFKY
ncbi:delta(24)-sterol C-methyltransferase [Clostridium fermenticellae]|uniref:Delta(24)-sterol C-methyltransferase n=1 Tax=Clostridium fermenticellae TaxID=2068654 RepID=A0A386H2C7_9CLOT|nr:DHH family phosphoesterase [Clostridium fermenticellae]AYD39852.1 delta(24)-sterol C-methyltransferase [Clostridium fermenticellae]